MLGEASGFDSCSSTTSILQYDSNLVLTLAVYIDLMPATAMLAEMGSSCILHMGRQSGAAL